MVFILIRNNLFVKFSSNLKISLGLTSKRLSHVNENGLTSLPLGSLHKTRVPTFPHARERRARDNSPSSVIPVALLYISLIEADRGVPNLLIR